MIASLRGKILERGHESLVLEAGGVGYELHVAPSALARLGEPGGEAFLFVFESVAMYGGASALYGFASREERALFLCFKEHVPATGAKKALEYLERASKAPEEFKRAVREEDARSLCGVFGFTQKTAQRLLAALKDKLGPSLERPARPRAGARLGEHLRTLEALASLGYKPAESRAALDAVCADLEGRKAEVEELLRLALRKL